MKWLGQYLEGKVPLFSIVVFSERCELKKVTVESPGIHVIQREKLYTTVRGIWDESADVLNRDEVAKVYGRLEVLTHADRALKEIHIQNIKECLNCKDAIIIWNELHGTVTDNCKIR